MTTKIFLWLGFIAIMTSNSTIAQIIPYSSELIEDNYTNEIEAHRVREDISFRNKETTLLSDDYFMHFTGLNYFSVDIRYRLVGKLIRLSKTAKMDLEMTNGTPYGFVHYGKINFYMEGESIDLQVFEFPSRDSVATAIFVPFTDLTTGKENFGGGRFLIINIPKGEQIVVDFNLAINPICVYDPDYSCPISPKSNFISKKIIAGATMYYDPRELNSEN